MGQLGLDTGLQLSSQPSPVPFPASAAAPPTAVAAGLVSSAALCTDGTAYVWGDASAGRLGLPGVPLRPSSVAQPRPYVNDHVVWTPTLLAIAPSAVGLAAGTPVRVVACALGGAFSLFLVHPVAPPPQHQAQAQGGTAIIAGGVLLVSGCLGVDVTKDTYGYPPNSQQALDATVEQESKAVIPSMLPEAVAPFGIKPCVLGIAAGARHAAVVAALPGVEGPRLFTAGKGWLGHTESSAAGGPGGGGGGSTASSGGGGGGVHTNPLHALGSGSDGSILIPPPSTSPLFRPVGGALEHTNVLDATCGHSHTVARAEGGALWSWGRGDSGELGQGSLSDKTMPALVKNCAPGHVWASMSAGSYYTCAVAVPTGTAEGQGICRALGSGATAMLVERLELLARCATGSSGGGGAGGGSGASAGSAGGAAGKGATAGASSGVSAAIMALAQKVAKEQWEGGHGSLPPGWDYENDDDGDMYFIRPDGETQWEDPRDNFDDYVAEFISAAKRGVDLNTV